MTTFTKILYVITALVLAGGLLYAYVYSQQEPITKTISGNTVPQSQSTGPSPYLKGQVVAVNIAGKMLAYNPYIFDILGTTTISVSIPDGIPVYRADDSSGISTASAQRVATLEDIRQGQTIFVVADVASLNAEKIIPRALIISDK